MNDHAAKEPVAIVGLGSSAGGLQALTEFLEALPAATGMAFVVIQHLAAAHESMLSTILARSTPMKVIEVDDEPRVEANTVYVIPPNRSMLILDGKLTLAPRKSGVPHAIDIFMGALAESWGHRAIGVVLSGTGNDGMIGIEAIKTAGGITFAQDGSAQHGSMPQNAIDSGCIDFVLPPREIAVEIARLAESQDFVFATEVGSDPQSLDAILNVIRQTFNVDFSQYKTNTLQRRIRRRMALHRIATFQEYTALLRCDPKEVEAVHQDILISVTSFFRNPESFDALRKTALPRFLGHDRANPAIRVWVIGCSTGEEAYSLGILIHEYLTETNRAAPITIFATDINEASIERARRAWYPKTIEQDVSRERLARYFVEVEGGYIVSKTIRELCVFAQHNALTDPPFSRIDLVSCRNMLIYLQAALQRRLTPMLHYALNPNGMLFLGPSENITFHQDLFDTEDLRNKLYSKRAVNRRPETAFLGSASGGALPASAVKKFGAIVDSGVDLQREIERTMMKAYVPPAVVVNEDGEVLHFKGDTDVYLVRPEGRPSNSLIKMAREGLLGPIRSVLQQIKNNELPGREEGVLVTSRDGLLPISLNVVAVPASQTSPRCFCIFFEPAAQRSTVEREIEQPRYTDEDADRQIATLSKELAATREYLESTIESQQASNEELQSANEEVQSTNEELQSTNEELETSKEEIQSSNEELITVNEELRMRNDELDRANDDMNNLFASVQMTVVMVWRDMRIRRFTPLAQQLFNFLPTDIGRSITDMRLNLEIPQFSQLLSQVIEQGVAKELEVRSPEEHIYLLRIMPYRTGGKQVDGAVIILIDIDALARAQEALKRRVEELAIADRHKNEFLAILAHELRNPLVPLRNAAQILKISPNDAEVSAKARDLVERQVRHMSRMVNDLLDAARAQHGQIKLQLERCDLRSVVQRALEVLQTQFHGKQQQVRVMMPEEPVEVDGDATRLDQIAMNLLSNANKYTASGGRIEVRLEKDVLIDAAPRAVLRIRDNGQGIDADLLPRLFELFSQADRSLAHSEGGLGIGLSLVRTLMELHGGTVSVHSDGANCGSEFTLRFPLTTETLENSIDVDLPSVDKPTAIPMRHRILLVDDNIDITESSKALLEHDGHTVQTAGSGREALERALEFQPTVILLDLGLPDIDGYEVARRLRRLEQFATVRLIAISGYDTPEARAQSKSAGFDAHLGKPVNLFALDSFLSV